MTLTIEELNSMFAGNPGLCERNKELAQSLGFGEPVEKKAKANKYFNRKVYVYEDGFVGFDPKQENHGKVKEKYDSVKEFRRGKELEIMQEAGAISDLRRQVKLVIQEAFVYRGEKVNEIAYVADFVYTRSDGEHVVEDVKGIDKNDKEVTATKDFKLKWKLLKAKYPQYLFTFAP